MEIWKRNLYVCWFGMFVTSIGFSQIAPVLPLYIKMLGVTDTASIERLSGIAFGATFIISAIFSPVWGHMADKVGRKPMLLRASLGMAVFLFSMGFAGNVYQFIGLRLILGVITGYSMACITLIATQVPRNKAGWALGTLSTSSISGSLLGPLLGAWLVETTSPRSVFWVTGLLMMVAFMATLLWVKETFVASHRPVPGLAGIWKQIPNSGLLLALFATSFMVSVALFSIEPILTVYIVQLAPHGRHVALMAGLTFAAAGLASIIAAPQLGKLADRVGPQRVLFTAMLTAGLLFIPQALVGNPWQLVGLRFLLGLATAGIMPPLNALVKHTVPDSVTGRVFGFNVSAQYLGVFCGSVMGGQVAALFGIKQVFFVTAALLLINAAWIFKTAIGRELPAFEPAPAPASFKELED